MLYFTSRAGCIMGIPGIVMGVVVISAGTSVCILTLTLALIGTLTLSPTLTPIPNPIPNPNPVPSPIPNPNPVPNPNPNPNQVPDALSSILVARNGQGDMAVSNVLGSNVFNIFLGLGFPWLMYTLINGKPLQSPGLSADLVPSIIILFGYLALLVLAMMAAGWKLYPKVGSPNPNPNPNANPNPNTNTNTNTNSKS